MNEFKVADLSEDQLQLVKALESSLHVTLIAYDKQESESELQGQTQN
jgi:hypothetical protein